LRARGNLAKEMVDEKRMEVGCKGVEEMIADGFSKPYDSIKHIPFTKLIFGHA
jgi:hypothetical protein